MRVCVVCVCVCVCVRVHACVCVRACVCTVLTKLSRDYIRFSIYCNFPVNLNVDQEPLLVNRKFY